MLTRRLRPKQNRLRNFSTVPLLYKCNDLQKNVAHFFFFLWGMGYSPKGWWLMMLRKAGT